MHVQQIHEVKKHEVKREISTHAYSLHGMETSIHPHGKATFPWEVLRLSFVSCGGHTITEPSRTYRRDKTA